MTENEKYCRVHTAMEACVKNWLQDWCGEVELRYDSWETTAEMMADYFMDALVDQPRWKYEQD